MNNEIRKIGWLWQWDFLRPLYWKEYQFWLHNVLPIGWSIITEPEEGADEDDYEKLVGITKHLPTTGAANNWKNSFAIAWAKVTETRHNEKRRWHNTNH